MCSRVGSRSSGFLVGSRSVVRSLPERLTVSRNLIVRDFRYPRSRAASAAILSVAVIFLAAFCRVGVAVDVRVRDWFCVELCFAGFFLQRLLRGIYLLFFRDFSPFFRDFSFFYFSSALFHGFLVSLSVILALGEFFFFVAFFSFISSCFTELDGFGTALVWSDWSAILGPSTAASVTSGPSGRILSPFIDQREFGLPFLPSSTPAVGSSAPRAVAICLQFSSCLG